MRFATSLKASTPAHAGDEGTEADDAFASKPRATQNPSGKAKAAIIVAIIAGLGFACLAWR